MAPTTGSSYRAASRILAGLGAISVFLAVGVILLAGNQFKANEGLKLTDAAPVLSVTDAGCTVEIIAEVKNIGDGLIVVTGTAASIRVTSDGGYSQYPVSGEISSVALAPEAENAVIARFPLAGCDPAATTLFSWRIHYERPDGTRGTSSLSLEQGELQ